jgi:hypothetical protein
MRTMLSLQQEREGMLRCTRLYANSMAEWLRSRKSRSVHQHVPALVRLWRLPHPWLHASAPTSVTNIIPLYTWEEYALVQPCLMLQQKASDIPNAATQIFDLAPKKRDRCLQEVHLLRQLDHPHIMHMLDAFIDNNQLIIICEWAPGGEACYSLAKLLMMISC